MSTLDEAISKRHRLSVWHVYHKGDEHISIIPFLNARKELGSNKKRHDKLAARYPKSRDRTDESNSYFVHHPTLLFHNTPRTLRRGNRKNGAPICLIKCGAFWRNWTIQFGGNLKDVIDPRGVVKWECRSNPNNTTLNDDRALKGYKVRTWRVWGESGETYHRQVNARRKAEKEEVAKGKKKANVLDNGPVGMENITEAGKQDSRYSQTQFPSLPSYSAVRQEAIPQPAVAEEAVRLNWTSPFSLNPRRYSFEYANIKFSWKGTRDVHPDDKLARWLMPLSSLGLRVKISSLGDTHQASHTGNLASCGFSILRYPSCLARINISTCTEEAAASELRYIRQTRLYELIMATAMCMIIGESQKRMIIMLLFTIAAEGGNSC
ncbi:hypothetical protein N7449_009539 [Penicillium cf. viridicatum]|uniref:Uncharacterized protein n=1 Tax=Penicillium cf. viridicatum TaxID=2972119 RepID=A0A9W9JBV3_9EURO|nr:hypothetical protein N7449_009539 [Penicillium cf. viridicatum]